MRNIFFLVLMFYTACTLPEEKKAKQVSEKTDTTTLVSSDANAANTTALDTNNFISLPVVKKIKSPNGIYQAAISNKEIEQTIAFNTDLTYRLQEKYRTGEKDSLVITEGTWTPSDGFIWLYKDQVASGRYKWKGDTLQYYSPVLKKNFSMHHLQDALENTALKNKDKDGIILFATGNEPFWKVELNNKGSLSFLLPEWEHPVKMKVVSSFNKSDSIGYTAMNDSSQIHVTVFPHFCTDGTSNYVYRNKVSVQYNQKLYSGCGILYK